MEVGSIGLAKTQYFPFQSGIVMFVHSSNSPAQVSDP
jgi:hypothetical protein